MRRRRRTGKIAQKGLAGDWSASQRPFAASTSIHPSTQRQDSVISIASLIVIWARRLTVGLVFRLAISPLHPFRLCLALDPLHFHHVRPTCVATPPLALPAAPAAKRSRILDRKHSARRRPRQPLRSPDRLVVRYQARPEIREGRLGGYLVLRIHWQLPRCRRCICLQA